MAKTRKLFLLITFLAAACGQLTDEVVVNTWPDGSPKDVHHYVVEGTDSTLVKQVSYYESGQKRQEGKMLNGSGDGKWKYWYEDGTLWVEGYFSEGVQSGPVIFYHPNGQKHSSGTYEKGIRTGKWKFWDEQGRLLKVIDYDQ